jgi:hypothetical protein
MVDSALLFDNNVKIAGTSGSNTLIGDNSKPETFYIKGDNTGNDTIRNFGRNDILVVDKILFDSNGDDIITFGSNGRLNLDAIDTQLPGQTGDVGDDTVRFQSSGDLNSNGIRYIGTDGDGHYAYAAASVRLAGFIEGKLGVDALSGTEAADSFFFDTDLDVAWGNDTISDFGDDDLIVTTSAIFDGNGDGKITFRDGTLDLNGSDELGNDGQQNQNSPFGKISINGGAVTELEFKGSTVVNGVTYYSYGLELISA